MINRRKLLLGLALSGLAAPLASFAQQPGRVWHLGFLAGGSGGVSFDGFNKAMRELGYFEGKNLVIDWRFANGKVEPLARLAAELVQSKVDLILVTGVPTARAAKQATNTIPIILAYSLDPVSSGLINSLARPGGNITGVSALSSEVVPKHLELLKTMLPKLTRVAVLTNPMNPGHHALIKGTEDAAHRIGVRVQLFSAQNSKELTNAFTLMNKERVSGVILLGDAFFTSERRNIAELALRNRLPYITGQREYVDAGGLMSYGLSLGESFRHAAVYVDKIIKGAKPGDIPVELPTKFELVINRKSAKALGLAIPQELLLRADEVIE